MSKISDNLSQNSFSLSESSESPKDFLQKKRKQKDKKISLTKYNKSKPNPETRNKIKQIRKFQTFKEF